MPLPISIIDTPPIEPRDRATALTSYLPLDTTATANGNENRWMAGVSFVPLGCDQNDLVGRAFDPCVQHDFPAARAFEDTVTFLPFEGDVAISCSPLSLPRVEMEKHLDVLVERAASRLFGIQVMEGTYVPTNPSLRTDGVDVSYGGSGIDSPANALAAIEDGLASTLQGGQGMIHLTPGVFSILQDLFLFENGRYYTTTGHIVVADAGYRGPVPDGVVTAGISWIYGSSPVRFKYATPNLTGEWWENFDYAKDIQYVRVSVVGLAVYEPCSVVAALVDWSP